jgi:hypothetical protein
MTPVSIDVISPIPERPGLCGPCELILTQADLDIQPETQRMEDMPHDWLEDYGRLMNFIAVIVQDYGKGVLIRVFDPRSFQGMWKSLRHGVSRYPTFIVAGHHKISGLDEERVSQALNKVFEALRNPQ